VKDVPCEYEIPKSAFDSIPGYQLIPSESKSCVSPTLSARIELFLERAKSQNTSVVSQLLNMREFKNPYLMDIVTKSYKLTPYQSNIPLPEAFEEDYYDSINRVSQEAKRKLEQSRREQPSQAKIEFVAPEQASQPPTRKKSKWSAR